MSIEMIYHNYGVTIIDNGKFITSGASPQHYVTAKNAHKTCLANGYEVTERSTNKERRVTLIEVAKASVE